MEGCTTPPSSDMKENPPPPNPPPPNPTSAATATIAPTNSSPPPAKRQRPRDRKNSRRTTKDPLQQLSHALSWALRHQALELKFTIHPDGFVPLIEILQCPHPKLRGYTREQIETVVHNNDKQRFALQEKPAQEYRDSPHVRGTTEGMIWCIRANQGHSLHHSVVDPEQLLTTITPQQLQDIPCIVHGTYLEAWKQIQMAGFLSRMKRQHIHFARGMPGDVVISGMRKSCQIYIYLNAVKCAKEGIVFYESANGVLLTTGKRDGTLPLDYVARVTTSAGEVLLDRNSEQEHNRHNSH